jgi:hypothetical protein
MSTSPASTIRRAARRAGSISSRQASGETARAASDGQIVDVAARLESRSRIASSSLRSVAEILWLRQAALQ